MSLPATVDWTSRYTLPQRTWGDATGDCVPVAWVYGMEMRNILKGGAPVQLSELDLRWQMYFGAGFANGISVCREDLWPYSLISPTPAIPDPYQAMLSGTQLVPSAAAVADRANHRVLPGGIQSIYTAIRQDFIDQCRTAIAAGYPIVIGWPPNHAVCAWGYDQTGFMGFDGRATSPGTYQLNYDDVFNFSHGATIISDVTFNAPAGRAMTTTNISAATFAVAGNNPTGTVSIVATYSGDANNLPSTSAPLILPLGAVTAPAPEIQVPRDVASVTDPTGAAWTRGAASQYGFLILRNGVSAAGGQGTIISLKNGQIKVQNNLGNWYPWTGSNWGNATTAP